MVVALGLGLPSLRIRRAVDEDDPRLAQAGATVIEMAAGDTTVGSTPDRRGWCAIGAPAGAPGKAPLSAAEVKQINDHTTKEAKGKGWWFRSVPPVKAPAGGQ